MKSKMLILLFTVVLIVIVFTIYIYIASKSPSNGKQLTFEVHAKEGFSSISKRLYKEKVLSSKYILLAYGKLLLYRGEKLQKGRYLLNDRMSPYTIAKKLIEGDILEEKIVLTIPEGYNIYDISSLLYKKNLIKSETEFINLTKDKTLLKEYNIPSDTLEGYLYPTTYYLKKDTKPQQLIKRMLKTFDEHFPYEEFGMTKEKLKLTKHEVVTLSSLIEKETSIPFERGIVSGVYHNRLRINMRLECDPTVIYALLRENKYKGNLSRKRGDLDIKSPYNTYLNKKLPPSPIANPGKASIVAALNPDDNKYIYFVAKDDRSHLFSETWIGHLKNIELYKRWLRKKRNKK